MTPPSAYLFDKSAVRQCAVRIGIIGSQFVAKLHAEALKRVPGAKLLAAAG